MIRVLPAALPIPPAARKKLVPILTSRHVEFSKQFYLIVIGHILPTAGVYHSGRGFVQSDPAGFNL
jgi:hypothetical protein